jgi:hypothetical protein
VSRCRFRDDSPSSEEHSKSWRGGSGHGGRSASGTPDVSCTEGRRLRKCRRDAAALSASSGTRARQQPATTGTSDTGGRRDSKKARGAATQSTASSNSSLDSIQATTAVTPSATPSAAATATLLECPAPNCNKKFRDPNGLQYHQSHAHRKQVESVAHPHAETGSGEHDGRLQRNGSHHHSGKHVLSTEQADTGVDSAIKSTTAAAKRQLSGAENGDVSASKRPRVECSDGPEGAMETSEVNGAGTSAAAQNNVVDGIFVKQATMEPHLSIKREIDAMPSDDTAAKDDLDIPCTPVKNFRKSKMSSMVSKDQSLRPPNAAAGKSSVGGVEAISPAYSDISDSANVDGGSVRPGRGDEHRDDHGAVRHQANGRLSVKDGRSAVDVDPVARRAQAVA